jgi:hypothetical protein
MGAGLGTCGCTGSGVVWIRKESRGNEDEKTEGDGDGDCGVKLIPSSKLTRGVRGIDSLRGLRASHSERAGVEGAEDSVGEPG